MKQGLILVISWLMGACAHTPRCGNPDGAKIIFVEGPTCKVRIRQVTVGSEMKVPESLKNTNFSSFQIEWIEPSVNEGRVSLGHFELVPSDSRTSGVDK
ncbi:MAG TPA: hypothetical protein VIG33_10690 [Pseudobdellovibrionaceae bacterium]|jgi:hypothetical protein